MSIGTSSYSSFCGVYFFFVSIFTLTPNIIFRIHRIGQTAEKIYVRKFFVTNSIEERILELQKRKKNIARAALCDKEAVGADGIGARQSLEDFKILFGESTSL